MSVNWTEEQRAAINTKGCNVLVSAGAGSGKSAVLVERVIERIIPENDSDEAFSQCVDISNILIVTFTKDATAELRGKFASALDNKLRECTSPKIAERILRQKTLLAGASIYTIDAFCKDIVSRNFSACGIDPNYILASDPAFFDETKHNVMNEILNNHYSEVRKGNEPWFKALSEAWSFGELTDEAFENTLYQCYDFAQKDAFPEHFIENHLDAISDEGTKYTDTELFRTYIAIMTIKISGLLDAYGALIEKAESSDAKQKSVDLLKQEKDYAEKVKKVFSGDITFDNLSDFPEGKLLTGIADEKIKNEISKEHANLKKRIKEYPDIYKKHTNADNTSLTALREEMKCLKQVLVEFSRALLEEKKRIRTFGFEDIEHLALNVLVNDLRNKPEAFSHENNPFDSDFEPTKTALEYQKKYDEIYIDEYQDTSLMQEIILTAVSGRGRGEHNIFMVGDVKQSIYQFRGARPDIFMDKFNKYERFGFGDNTKRYEKCLIPLNANFRSRKCIIDAVNEFFEQCMTQNTCGITYDEEHKLRYGAAYYDAYPQNEEGENAPVKYVSIENCPADETRKHAGEYIAREIQRIISEKIEVYDAELKKMRPANYSDIAILTSKNDNIPIRRELIKHNVPISTLEENHFYKNPEIMAVASFLKALDNSQRDVQIMAIMRSPFYMFTDNEIAIIVKKKEKKDSLIGGCRRFIADQNNASDAVLYGKVKSFLDSFDKIRLLTKTMSVSDIVRTIYNTGDFYRKVISSKAGESAKVHLRAFLAKAMEYDGNGGLYGFVAMLDTAFSAQRSSEDEEAVKVSVLPDMVIATTLHKSKGLEYPIVFLSNLSKSAAGGNNGIVFHSKYGFGPEYLCDDELLDSPMYDAIKEINIHDERCEAMRLLYVGMTRARERLYIIDSGKDSQNFREAPITDYSVNSCSNLAELVLLVAPKCAAIKNERLDYSQPEEESAPAVSQESDNAPETQNAVIHEEQTGEEETGGQSVPLKISVSDIKRFNAPAKDEENNEPEAALISDVGKHYVIDLKELDFEKPDSQKLTAMQKGSLVHTFLECMDFSGIKNVTDKFQASGYVENQISAMVDKNIFNEKTEKEIDRKLLTNFVMSDIAKRMADANLQREIPFTLLMKWKDIFADADPSDGEKEVSVQGIIDCFFEENGEIVLIDYKTDVPEKGVYKRDASYRVQLECYKKAIEEITGKKVKESILVYLHSL